MSIMQQLISFHIIQKKPNKQALIIWTFPSISEEHKSVILKSLFKYPDKNIFNILRYNEWFYVQEFEIKENSFALCLITTDYDPPKYETFCNILIQKYQKTSNPVELVKLYLNVFTQGSVSIQENGTLVTYDFKKYNFITNVKEMIKAFGLEIILIYNCILLKKRLLVYHQNSRKLQKALLSISKLMSHRNPNDYLYPNIDDFSETRGKMFFVVGTTNSKPNLSSEFYDVYVNLPSRQISISTHAKETFAMNKTHKDLAVFITELAENTEITESQLVLEINAKTQELLANLKSLATATTDEDNKVITLEALRAKKFNPITENFLFNLAVAENIMML